MWNEEINEADLSLRGNTDGRGYDDMIRTLDVVFG